MFKVPEVFRIKENSVLASDASYGNNGAFAILFKDNKGRRVKAFIIASDGRDWEHVSVHIDYFGNGKRIPSWDEMCIIKDMFWDKEDCVVQYHPPKSKYVDRHKYTLHLWRPIKASLPTPPVDLVG